MTIFRRLGQSDPSITIPGLWDTRLIGICCRYLNSGLPVLVASGDHAFVLCGYHRERRAGKRDWITFIRHDDQRGPYLLVGNVLDDVDQDTGYRYSPWQCLIVPLPAKLWLPPEPAEFVGAFLMRGLAQALSATAIRKPVAASVSDLR